MSSPGRRATRLATIGVTVACLFACFPAVQAAGPDALEKALSLAGAERNSLAPDPLRVLSSPRHAQHLPLYRALMREPLQAGYRAGVIESHLRSAIASPLRLMMLAGNLSGSELARGYFGNPLADLDEALLSSPDPLASALDMLSRRVPGSWHPEVPPEQALPHPLRTEVARMIAAIARAERFRQRALARFPVEATPQHLLGQAIEGRLQPFEEPDYRMLFPLLEREALMAGMLDLVAATEDFVDFLATAGDLPAVSWRLATPAGLIVIDTHHADNRHDLEDALLVVDGAGDDSYHMRSTKGGGRISILVDRSGNDRYVALDPGACPASALMGYGILWDAAGDDRYEGGMFAQAAALFGAALLVDGGGKDEFVATGHAQAFAAAGAALLVSMEGDDTYHALTHAQASGGPEGAAVLLDASGNDRYVLAEEPLLRPSAQLADRNLSMGQGAGSGLRADLTDGRTVSGGLGLLIDFAGDDRYAAQVFAQGAAFFEAVGILIDGGGHDAFEAAWYAAGASAHQAAGVFIDRGAGHDRYSVSHSTSLGAAHDYSVAFFIDEGGDDDYVLGDLGIGAAHDNSIAFFTDAAGNDRYAVRATACAAFGAAKLSGWSASRENAINTGLFMDLSGSDRYESRCTGPGNDSAWIWPRRHADLTLRSESGAGIDGRYPSPFHTRPLTRDTDEERDSLNAALEARRAWRMDPRYVRRR